MKLFNRISLLLISSLVFAACERDYDAPPLNEPKAEDLQDALMQKKATDGPSRPRTIVKRGGKNEIIEIDLHIGELLDDTRGMSNSEILNYQLDKFREVMEQYRNKREQRIVFIHGKGNTVSLLDFCQVTSLSKCWMPKRKSCFSVAESTCILPLS